MDLSKRRLQQYELDVMIRKWYIVVMVTTLLWIMKKMEMVEGQWVPCENMCGQTPVMYPFSSAKGCGGTKEMEEYVKCNKQKGKLVLSTETGEYTVEKIDYSERVMMLHDPAMSTCASMWPRSSSSSSSSTRKWWFELPAGSPFTIDSRNTFLLLGCSNHSHSNDYICDDSGTPVCKTIFSSCSSLANLGLSPSSYTNSCCLYDSYHLQNQPSLLNLPLLHCTAYMDIYSFDPYQSSSSNTGNLYQDPLSWSYGILLKFYYDDVDADTYQYSDSSCARCQESNGVCSYNSNGFICVCPNSFNITTHCSDYNMAATSREAIHNLFPIIGFSGLLGVLSFGW